MALSTTPHDMGKRKQPSSDAEDDAQLHHSFKRARLSPSLELVTPFPSPVKGIVVRDRKIKLEVILHHPHFTATSTSSSMDIITLDVFLIDVEREMEVPGALAEKTKSAGKDFLSFLPTRSDDDETDFNLSLVVTKSSFGKAMWVLKFQCSKMDCELRTMPFKCVWKIKGNAAGASGEISPSGLTESSDEGILTEVIASGVMPPSEGDEDGMTTVIE